MLLIPKSNRHLLKLGEEMIVISKYRI